ncbi:unnamed protein product [Penicillium egyptiacum]|uniref:PNPLA domain-containing protein n=1 Tax=Penicillium egyptiacum TaxID=1303716 RepID=A0A9W4KCG3_9EURO|nr:unnamed protein product [Penicillium egyptiacum]
MQHLDRIGWLEICLGRDSRLAIHDKDRLQVVIDELAQPDCQYPSLCTFLGNKEKDLALQYLYPQNNIKRYSSCSNIRLRPDTMSLNSTRPVLFADGDVQQLRPLPDTSPEATLGNPVLWECCSMQAILIIVWARLVFLFTDVICIFGDDLDGLKGVAEFLAACIRIQSASSFPSALRPRVIVALRARTEDLDEYLLQTELFYHQLYSSGDKSLNDSFSAINFVYLDESLSPTARYERLRALIKGQIQDMTMLYRDNGALPSATQLVALFGSALQHLTTTIDRPFNFVESTRVNNKVSQAVGTNIAHYHRAGKTAGFQGGDIAPVVAAALLMDHYFPEMLGIESALLFLTALPPRMVFHTLYKEKILEALQKEVDWPQSSPEELTNQIECQFITVFDEMVYNNRSSAELRKRQLVSQYGRLCRIRSNRICLYCILRVAQHTLGCGHTMCDTCAQIFGVPVPSYEYRFQIAFCLHCLYRRPLIIDVLPPTMSPSVLAIDGGGVRGVIPLEFLLLLQEHLRPCQIPDIFDLGVGTSSGTPRLYNLEPSNIGKVLAKHIFRERRRAALPWLMRILLSRLPVLGSLSKWIIWLLYDSCYDSRVFESTLKVAFHRKENLFGPFAIPSGPLFSGAKFGVTATSISRNTNSFIMGNFNAVQDPGEEDHGYEILRPYNVKDEPRVCQAPAHIRGIGSFQDGGLQYNFTGAIASQLCHRIWPSRGGPARLLSLGTGITDSACDRTPHFRHVFSDGFLRRGFDAWMSSMDTEQEWHRMRNQLSEASRPDYFRFNVPLGGIPSPIDAVAMIKSYRDLVLLQPGSARIAREAASALLASRFYFELTDLPPKDGFPFWCHGVIRCKGQAKDVVQALSQLHPQGLDLAIESKKVGHFGTTRDICCECGCFVHPVIFLVRHSEETIDIRIRPSPHDGWRINGFPANMASFEMKQSPSSPFGRSDHGYLNRAPCINCISHESSRRTRGTRRRRGSGTLGSREEQTKRVCL